MMGLATVAKFEGSIFGSYPFWELFVTMCLFWISQAVTWSLQDVICFDLLGDNQTQCETYISHCQTYLLFFRLTLSSRLTYIRNTVVYDSGDKTEDFGKSRCWGSISWGIFSIFGGALIDYFSVDDLVKNYIPIYYLCLTIILCDFAIAYKMKVSVSCLSRTNVRNGFNDL